MVSEDFQVENAGLSRRQFLRVAGTVALVGGGMVGSARPARALTINPRSSWAIDRPPLGPLSTEDVRFLLVHHSASQNGHTTADAPGILRSFYDFHTSPEKGWNDIAYNFLIDSGGGVWEGRFGSIAGSVAGDATGGNQGFSQLACVIGDYNAATPSTASKQSLVSLLAWLADKHGVATSPGSETTFVSKGSNKWPAGVSVTTPTITGHRNMSNTTCPGDNLYSFVVGSLMADVTATRGGAPVATTTEAGAASTAAAAPSTTSTVEETTTAPTVTSTIADPIPTPVPTTAALPPNVPDPFPTVLADPVVTLPVVSAAVADSEIASTTVASPLVWGGAGLATLATGLLAWRYRRMNR